MLLAAAIPVILLCAAAPSPSNDAGMSAWLETYLEAEAKHIGVDPGPPDALIVEFERWLKREGLVKQQTQNNVELHQRIVVKFCSARTCRWRQFYAVLKYLRTPFAQLFEPGPPAAVEVEKLRRHAATVADCVVLDKPPTAQEFWGLVVANKPAIFRGVAKAWPAVRRWTYRYLEKAIRSNNVVVSASPHGGFDTPEDAALWETGSDSPLATDGWASASNVSSAAVVARPGHVTMRFGDLVQMLRRRGKASAGTDGSLYLEYYPLSNLHRHRDKDSGADLAADLDMLRGIEFANILSPEHRLIWFGAATTGSLHFDRNENLMVVLRGAKTFNLLPPSMSRNVYGGEPIRAAHYTVEANVKDASLDFERSATAVDKDHNSFHTYSPVNISDPRAAERFPRYRHAKAQGFPISCRANEGDAIFVPSGWWHEVSSHPDNEGKTIGVNIFYDSMYYHLGFNVTSGVFIQRQLYNHLRATSAGGLGLLRPCDDEYVCFEDGVEDDNDELLHKLMRMQDGVETDGGRGATKGRRRAAGKADPNTVSEADVEAKARAAATDKAGICGDGGSDVTARGACKVNSQHGAQHEHEVAGAAAAAAAAAAAEAAAEELVSVEEEAMAEEEASVEEAAAMLAMQAFEAEPEPQPDEAEFKAAPAPPTDKMSEKKARRRAKAAETARRLRELTTLR